MSHFNPDSPAVLGLQWEPLFEDRTSMDSPLEAFAARLRASATETVDEAWLYSALRGGRTPEAYQLDVYEDGDFPDPSLAVYTAYPTGDATTSGASTWDGSVVGTSGYFSFIDNPTQTPVTLPDGDTGDDDFIFATAGIGYSADFYFDGVSAPLAGFHIARVRLRAVVQPYAGVGQVGSMTLTPYLRIGGTPYPGTTKTVSGRVPGGQEVVHDWYFNPAELRGWLPDDLDGFDSGTATASAGWTVNPTGNGFVLASILQGQLEIHHAGVDLRVATGHLPRADQLAGVDGWFPVDLAQPDGTPGWAKANGTDYRLEWRRLSIQPGGLRLFMIALSGFDNREINGWSRQLIDYDADTRLASSAADSTDGLSWAPGVGLEVSGTPSVDSQPYIELDEADTPVFVGHEVRQYLTTPGTLPVAGFSVIRAVVGKRGAVATDSITISVHRASDDVQMGSSVVLTPEEFDLLATAGGLTSFATYRTVELHLASAATLATSTQYYLKFVSPAATEDGGWRIQVPRSDRYPTAGDTPPPGIDTVGFGGTTDSWWRDGSALTAADGAAVLATPVDTPADVAATVLVSGISDCIQYVAVVWTATALGGSFLRYEVQRQDDPDDAWVLIANILDEAVEEFDDYESKRGQEASYRVRVIRSDGTPSPWSPVTSATAEAPCCGYLFTTNVAPELTMWADDVGPERKTDTPENVQVVQFYNRDYQVAFHELEDRGQRFKRTLQIAVGRSLDGTPVAEFPTREVFGRLAAVARPAAGAGLPYVCVHEETGNRWFASLLTPGTAVRKNVGLYQADVEIIEVTDTPYAPTVEA